MHLGQPIRIALDDLSHIGISRFPVKEFFQDTLDLLQAKITADTRAITLELIWEFGDPAPYIQQLQVFVDRIRQQYPLVKIFLLLNSWFKSLGLDHRLHGIDDITYIDLYLLRLYHKLILFPVCDIAKDWDPQAPNILFLTGKPDRVHRIRLLYKLLNTPLRESLDWSLMISEANQEKTRDHVSDIDETSWQWLLAQQRNCDGHMHSTVNNGLPFDPDMYARAKFQIISETYFDHRPWIRPHITEKCWLPMINHRPFIMAGEFKTLEVLEKLGFYTFKEFMAIPNYDDPDADDFLHYGPRSSRQGLVSTPTEQQHILNFYEVFRDPSWPDLQTASQIQHLPAHIQDEIKRFYISPVQSWAELRLQAVVENALFWKDTIAENRSEITKMIQHNYDRFLWLGQHNIQQFKIFARRHGLVLQYEELFSYNQRIRSKVTV